MLLLVEVGILSDRANAPADAVFTRQSWYARRGRTPLWLYFAGLGFGSHHDRNVVLQRFGPIPWPTGVTIAACWAGSLVFTAWARRQGARLQGIPTN